MIACSRCGNVFRDRSELTTHMASHSQRHFNPMLDRIDRASSQSPAYHRAPKQEKELAKRVKGHRVPQSGAGIRKGDVSKRGIVRIEAKTTQAKSFSVTREMVEKITLAALGMDEIPVIVIEFLDAHGNKENEVAIVPANFLDDL